MPEPVTSLIAGLSLASVIGNLLAEGGKSLGGKIAEKTVDHLKGEALARAAGHFGLATNHDAEKAIRRAQMAALRYLVSEYEKNVPAADEAGAQWPLDFTDAAFKFAMECTGRCDQAALEADSEVIGAIARGLDAALGGGPTPALETRAASLRLAASEAVFNEMRDALGKRQKPVGVPEGFKTLFFNGGVDVDGDSVCDWHSAFMLFAAKALKTEPKFEKIFAATRLAMIAELSLDGNEVARQTQSVVNAMAHLLAANTGRLARMEKLIAEYHRENMGAHDETQRIARETLEETRKLRLELARKNGLDPLVLAPIFERLGQRGLSADEMHAQAEAAVAAFMAYVDGARVKSNLGPDIDEAIRQSRELARTLGRQAADQRLDAAMLTEDDAIAEALQVWQGRIDRKVAIFAEKARMYLAFFDPAAARQALCDILAIDPENSWAYVERGDLQLLYENANATTLALADFRAAHAIDVKSGDDVRIAIDLDRIGDVQRSRNDLEGALKSYSEGLVIRRRLAEADPSHAERARDVSVSLDRIGDVQRSRNDLEGALKSYSEGLVISRRLAEADPSHAERARDVSVSVNKIGDVQRSRNDLEGALKSYSEGLVIRRRLAEADPSHAERARDVSVSLDRIGDVQRSRNDLEGALKSYSEGLVIRRRLAEADPSHAERARDVAMSLLRIGMADAARGDRAAACGRFNEGHSIIQALADKAGDIDQLQQDLAFFAARIAEHCGGRG